MQHRQIIHELIRLFLIIVSASLVVLGQINAKDETCGSLTVQAVERQMSGAATHCYQIELSKDQFLQVKVEQKGIDVALKFYDAKGQAISEIDSPNGTQGFEILSLIAPEAGVYKLEISSLDAAAPKGSYVVLRDAVRSATEQDRQGIEAQSVFGQAQNAAASSPQTAVNLFQKAGKLFRGSGNKNGEAKTLFEIGFILHSAGNSNSALPFCEKALLLFKAVQNQHQAASTLVLTGAIYAAVGEDKKAIEKFAESQFLFQDTDILEKADALQGIGKSYVRLGEFSKAIESFNKALSLFKAAAYPPGEAEMLSNNGVVYLELGQRQKALENFNQALTIIKKNNFRKSESAVLNNVGRVFDDLGDKNKALENFKLAYSIADGKEAKAAILLSIGKVYLNAGDKEKALENFRQSVQFFREVGDRYGESRTVNAIAGAYSKLGDKQKALEYYTLALKTQRSYGFKFGEGVTLGNLMVVWYEFSNRRLAIFYGKQAINLFQQIRAGNQKLDEESRRSFVKVVGNVYRVLAAALIDEGRISEAQEVMSLFKQEEFSQYTRRSSDSAPEIVRRIDLNAEETAAAKKYDDLNGKITEISQQISKLEAEGREQPAAPEKQAELQKMKIESSELNAVFDKYMQNLTANFARPVETKTGEISNSQTQLWQEKLAGFSEKTVLLTTLLINDNYYVIVTTPTEQIARKVKFDRADFDKIKKFRQLLQNPQTVILPTAQALYLNLIKSIEPDLTRINAKTLLWSLDGELRYVPFAALHDGRKYLVEKYTNAVVTLAQPPADSSVSPTNWRALGAGVSAGIGDFEPLINVPSELKAIVRDGAAENQKTEEGLFAGKRLLDGDFSRSKLTAALGQKFQLVHFATHFVFSPGKDVDSFLLLGSGEHLSLAEIRTDEAFDLSGVDLLTLSACETALDAPDASGVEIESFGVIAQKRGAKTVLASLWSISDNNTPQLMTEFYRQYQTADGTISKAEALRRAQISLLQKNGNGKNQTHPAYWASFIVLGEWR